MSRVDPSRLQLAIVHHRAGRLADAVKVSSEIVAAQPNNFDATYLLAVFHAEQGAIASAVEMFSRAVRLRPNSFDAHYNLAVAMNLAEEHEGALKHYKRALRLNPNHSDAINNYAVTLSKLRRFQDAVQQYRQLVHITPDHAEGHYYLSVVLTELEQFEDAIESAEKAIAIFPGYAEAYFSRGVALAESNRPEEALSSYEKAIALKPDYTDAYRNRDMLLLLLGDFDRGWSRWSGSQRQPSVGIRQFDKPLWLGDTDIAGKTLLVHWEQQGLGDTIQFCRFVPLLQDMRIRVLFMPQPALRALMSSLSNKIEIVGDDDGVLPDFDYHCPLMSLPFALKTTIESIPRRIPYLYAEADRVRKLWGGGGMHAPISKSGSPGKATLRRDSVENRCLCLNSSASPSC